FLLCFFTILNLFIALPGKGYIRLPGFPCLLLKSMQDPDFILKFGDIDHSPLTFLMNSNFHCTRPDSFHGLPIRRFLPHLYEMKLKPGIPPCSCREILYVFLAAADEFHFVDDRKYISSFINYQEFYIHG